MMGNTKIKDAASHRGLLLDAMESVVSGNIPTSVVNSACRASQQVHISQRQQWDGQKYRK